MESFATPYPVIFFDGEQEQDKGFVGIHSVLTFKRFQSLLSQKTGVPPNQLSTVFVCRRTLKDSEKRQRLPINGNTNFNILLNQHNPNKERDCYFLVSLKKSKRERKGSRKRGAETDIPDEWEFNSTSGTEGRGQVNHYAVEEALSQGSAGSSYAAEVNVSSSSMTAKQFTDGAMGNNRAGDNRAGRIILKRSNTAFFQSQGWNHGELQASWQVGGKVADEFLQLQSPRFAALRQEDQRDLNWRREDSFSRVKGREQWELQASYAYPHNVTAQTDSEYHPYSPESFNVPFPEEPLGHSLYRNGGLVESFGQSLYRNGGPEESVGHSLYRNGGFLDLNFSKPKFFASRTSPSSVFASFREADMQKAPDRFLERQPHLHYMSEGAWQKMPSVLGAFADFQDSLASIDYNGVEEEATHSFYCQLCSDCKRRNILPIPFHWCVEDAVTKGFRGPSPAGPIGRRPKTLHVEATA